MGEARATTGSLQGAALVAALVALCLAGGWLSAQLDLQAWLRKVEFAELFIAALLTTYVVAMALPFMPGIEIGLALMLLLGGKGILLVYLCTQLALALSFLCGRLVPARILVAVFRGMGQKRALSLVEDLAHATPMQRFDLLARRAPSGLASALLRHRYLAFAVALNLPGNALIGGAGGIGLLAGMSGVLSFARYALMVAAATSPVPAFLLFGGSL